MRPLQRALLASVCQERRPPESIWGREGSQRRLSALTPILVCEPPLPRHIISKKAIANWTIEFGTALEEEVSSSNVLTDSHLMAHNVFAAMGGTF